jgi:O-antigen ligase
MTQWLLLAGLGVLCFTLPNALLVPLSVAAVMMADTELLPRTFIYFARFVPIGILALKSLAAFSRKKALVTHPFILRAWAPFLALSGVSLIYSTDPWLSAQRYVSALLVFIGFGMGIPLFFPKIQHMRRVINLVGLLMALAIVYSVTQLPSEEAHIVMDGHSRGSGVFRNPNTFGLLAMQAVFLLVYLWQRETRSLKKHTFLVVTIIVGASVLLSGSRASVLGLVIGLLVLVRANLTFGTKARSNLLRLVVFVGVMLLVVETVFPQYLGALFRAETWSRSVLWQRAWALAQDNLWFGVGFAGSDGLFARDAHYLESVGISLSGAHSSLFRLLVDLGIVGVALAFIAFERIWRYGWRSIKMFEDRRLGAALLGAVAASLTNALFESWLFGFGSASTIPFWLFLALLSHQADVARYRALTVRRKQSAPRGAGNRKTLTDWVGVKT